MLEKIYEVLLNKPTSEVINNIIYQKGANTMVVARNSKKFSRASPSANKALVHNGAADI